MKAEMRRAIYEKMCLLALCTILLTFIATFIINFYTSQTQAKNEIQSQGRNIAAGYNHAENKEKFLGDLALDQSVRITIVDQHGRVIFDNFADGPSMENHNTRPEIVEARAKGSAERTRLSTTLGRQTYYYAIQADNHVVIRLSKTTSSLLMAIKKIIPVIAIITFFIFIASILMATNMTKAIVDPINRINLERPLENQVYEEFYPLLSKINNQNIQIEHQINELRQKQGEFSAITENMSEGLVLLDSKMNIISANKSAKRLLRAESKDYSGRSLIILTRNIDILGIVENALKGTNDNVILCEEAVYLQAFASPVYREEKISGCALLILDISDKYAAEQSRREFTANVSHELKTPLTSISGYSEMISLGLVKEEDIPAFAKKIHGEATHLISLIDDIIKLSQLDERKINFQKESLDIFHICRDVIERLDIKARKKNIRITLEGETCMITGVRQMISELVYNLCDNAVKYNVPNGTVEITVRKEEGQAILVVADSGVGIPEKEQARIFERFYRADKSHSKEIDGTGLGLAIVKHIAEYHKAKIQVASKVGQGTRFTIYFPLG